MTKDQPTENVATRPATGLASLNPALFQPRPESPVLGQDLNCFAFAKGQFELHLVYPGTVELPDSVTRLLKGICRQLEALATTEQGRK